MAFWIPACDEIPWRGMHVCLRHTGTSAYLSTNHGSARLVHVMLGSGAAVGAYAAALADVVQLHIVHFGPFLSQTTSRDRETPCAEGDTVMSNFEPNAMIRGFQLTIVGSEYNLNRN